MLGVISLPRIRWRIIHCPLLHPTPNQGQIFISERRLLLRHLRLTTIRRNLIHQNRLTHILRNDRPRPIFYTLIAPREKLRKIRHHIATLRPRWLMTPLTMSLKNGSNLFKITHRCMRIFLLFLRGRRQQRPPTHQRKKWKKNSW